MCAGALVNSRIDRVVYGAPDMKAGACYSLYNVCDDPRLNHRVAVTAGVRAGAFFATARGSSPPISVPSSTRQSSLSV